MGKYSVIVYRNEGNLGNTVQTMGLTKLLGETKGIYFDDIKRKNLSSEDIFIANGWFAHYPKVEPIENTIFCGIHLSGDKSSIEPTLFEWLRNSNKIIGARDPGTAEFLNSLGINSEFVGCASLLFEEYIGKREGVISVDFNGPGTKMTHWCSPEDTWNKKWKIVENYLNLYKKAEAVYTSRLHVALPCISMGTPVYIESNIDTRRFSILDSIGVKYNKLEKYNADWLKIKYKKFLEKNLGIDLEIKEAIISKI